MRLANHTQKPSPFEGEGRLRDAYGCLNYPHPILLPQGSRGENAKFQTLFPNKKSPWILDPGALEPAPRGGSRTLKTYLAVGVVEAAAGAVTFLPFLPFPGFLWFLWLTFAGVVAGAVASANTIPVVLPKNNTVIKAAISFFI